jgi:hypothetical protein
MTDKSLCRACFTCSVALALQCIGVKPDVVVIVAVALRIARMKGFLIIVREIMPIACLHHSSIYLHRCPTQR